MTRRYLQIALPSPLRRRFDYILPTRFGEPAIGARVKVPFGTRQMIGVITGIHTESAMADNKLRQADDLIDTEAVLPQSLHTLCEWASDYYQHPIGEVFSNALPVLLRQGEPIVAAPPKIWRLTELGLALEPSGLARAQKQLQAFLVLKEHPHGLSQTALKNLQIERTALMPLLKKALAEEVDGDVHTPHIQGMPLKAPALLLNDEQQIALDEIKKGFNTFKPYLLAGVTGSGKTEVYLQAIEAVLNEGKQALVLVPEIGLTPQTVARFKARFQSPIAVLHSGLTENERLNAWRAARTGEARIIIGTRSAIFTPMAQPGLIIVDEEHDLSFKQQDGFRYHARDLSIRRAQLENIPVVLGSATPALESLNNAEAGRYQLLRVKKRAANAPAPLFKLVDVRTKPLQEGFSEELFAALEQTLARGEQALIFLNRRGYSPVVLCHDCGWQAHCRRCDARPTLHRDPMRLHCHHCGTESRPPRHCPSCNSTDLRPVGLGTERAEDVLTMRFPKAPLFRIDRDTTRRKNAMRDMYETLNQGGPAILVGTQMLAKGHHFPNVTLVAILDVDGGLFGSDFRAPERTAQLIVQVAGRAGRAEKPGQVILQTRQPEHPLLQTLITQGFPAFAQSTLQERRILGFPPAGFLALLRAEAPRQDLPVPFLDLAANYARELGLAVEIWGPVPAPMEKRAGRFRAHLLLKAQTRAPLHKLLPPLIAYLDTLPEGRKVRWSVDVDPQELS